MGNEVVNVKNARHSYEFLKLINDAPETEQETLLKKWGACLQTCLKRCKGFLSDVEPAITGKDRYTTCPGYRATDLRGVADERACHFPTTSDSAAS